MYNIESQNRKFAITFLNIASAAKELTLATKDIQLHDELNKIFEENFIFKIGFPRQIGKTSYINDFIKQWPDSFVLLSVPGIVVSDLQKLVTENLNKKTFIIDGISSDDLKTFIYLIKNVIRKENKPCEMLKCSSLIVIE